MRQHPPQALVYLTPQTGMHYPQLIDHLNGDILAGRRLFMAASQPCHLLRNLIHYRNILPYPRRHQDLRGLARLYQHLLLNLYYLPGASLGQKAQSRLQIHHKTLIQ